MFQVGYLKLGTNFGAIKKLTSSRLNLVTGYGGLNGHVTKTRLSNGDVNNTMS